MKTMFALEIDLIHNTGEERRLMKDMYAQ